jgi:predicted glutamine amidotransferase
MCRLYGFRSDVPERVHQSLVREANSLRVQSHEHKDGWGIASYQDGPFPQVARGTGAAHADPEFERVSALVSSHAVLAHVRLASVGPVGMQNAHPFVYGPWAFAHNGTLQRFDRHVATLDALIDPDLRALIRGETDSERCFYLFLTLLRTRGSLERPDFLDVARTLVQTARAVVRITEVGATKPSSTNFMVTDGHLLVAIRRHRTLFYSERKRRGTRGRPPAPGEQLKQLVVASEMLEGENHWHELPEEWALGVDASLRFYRWPFDELAGSQDSSSGT